MIAKQPIPRSKATNAYELLEDVCKAIEEEPKRYDQGDWLRRCPIDSEADLKWLPACGTVACVAGWTVLLAGRSKALSAEMAVELLGIGGYSNDLFGGTAVDRQWRKEHKEGDVVCPHPPGSREYAELGIRHIRRFMAEHEQTLKLKKVVIR